MSVLDKCSNEISHSIKTYCLWSLLYGDKERPQTDSDVHRTLCYLKQLHLQTLLETFSNILPLCYSTDQRRHLIHYLCWKQSQPNHTQFVTQASKYGFHSQKVCAKYAVWQTSSKMVVEFLVVFLYLLSEHELRSLYVVVRLSVVCNVRAPYSGDWNFPQCFYAIWYPGHPWPFGKNFTELVPGETLCLGS